MNCLSVVCPNCLGLGRVPNWIPRKDHWVRNQIERDRDCEECFGTGVASVVDDEQTIPVSRALRKVE